MLERAAVEYPGQIAADGKSVSGEQRLSKDDSSEVFEYSDFRGEDVLGTAAAIPDLDWILVAEIDREEAFGWLSILRSRAVGTGIVTLALILILAVTFSNRLSKPMKRLANIAHRIADGHHGERLEPLEGKEAQEVGLAFNTMLDQLAASHARLQHAAALAAVGELSTSIVHEMRNPLSSVKMNLQALRRSVEDDNGYSELADIALDQTSRLEKMLTDLLNYGKPLSLDVKEVNFNELADDVVEVARKESEAKNVSLRIENGLKDVTLKADHEQLWRSLTNLVSNAVHAAPQDGSVTISGVLSPESDDWVAISVRDNGLGVDGALKETIFQPFYTTHDGGTGLGLANVKKIAEYHGGKGSVDNSEEGGAVFTLLLPLKGPPV
jgi:signal transduction histidine kinase